jgi:hypothetical protein
MKKHFLLVALVVPAFLHAQNVGIGTAAPTNRLHVLNASDPLRLEGVTSGAATDSVVTINTTGVIKRRAAAAFVSGSGWSLTGNANLSATTNFLGTTTLVPLIFRTNSFRGGQIDPDSTKRNNSFGHLALNTAVSGTANNAFGYQALAKVTTGSNNTAVGDSAAFTITTGNHNTFVGANAGYFLGIGVQNTAVGSRALATASAASNNVAIGYKALENNIASSNIAIGTAALDNSSTGSDNLAIGSNALGTVTTTSTNIAIGNDALTALITGSEISALGYRAGFALTTGIQNTALGHYAFSSTTASNYSTMVGYQAGANITGGSNNTFIGYNADASVVSPSNSSALGSGATVTQNNMVRVGGSGITLIGGSVGFSVISDERVKTNIRENVAGLDFIAKLRPVTYNYDLQKMDDLQGVKPQARLANPAKEQIRYSGFIAQDVLKAAETSGYDFSGVNKPGNDKSLYSINYAELVVPLVKAVQDLKAIIDKQQQEIEALKKAMSQK